MNKVKDPSDFWYHNGKVRLWKSWDEWVWLSGRMKPLQINKTTEK